MKYIKLKKRQYGLIDLCLPFQEHGKFDTVIGITHLPSGRIPTCIGNSRAYLNFLKNNKHTWFFIREDFYHKFNLKLAKLFYV